MTDHIILCVNCRKRLFVYKGDFTGPIRSHHFIPLKGVQAPKPREPMVCVQCGKPWYMVKVRSGGIVVLTNKGWKPSAPEGPQIATPSPQGSPLAYPDQPPGFQGVEPDFVDPAQKKRNADERKQLKG